MSLLPETFSLFASSDPKDMTPSRIMREYNSYCDSWQDGGHGSDAFAWLSYALGLQVSTQWCNRVELAAQNDVVRQRMYAGMQNAHVQPEPKPRRAITNAQLPRLNRHYRWTA